MPESDEKFKELYAGLKALVEHGFPKECESCGAVYEDITQFVELTKAVDGDTGLQTNETGSDVEMVRLCGCGQQLCAVCEDRRSCNPMAIKRRDLFEHLLGILTDGGMPRKMAKSEILKVMRGEPSQLLTSEQLARFFK